MNSFRTECFQPGNLGGQVVGVDVQVHPAVPRAEPLDQQPEPLPVRPTTVVLGMPLKLGKRLAGRRLPEPQLAVVICGWYVDDYLQQPAEMRHAGQHM